MAKMRRALAQGPIRTAIGRVGRLAHKLYLRVRQEGRLTTARHSLNWAQPRARRRARASQPGWSIQGNRRELHQTSPGLRFRLLGRCHNPPRPAGSRRRASKRPGEKPQTAKSATDGRGRASNLSA